MKKLIPLLFLNLLYAKQIQVPPSVKQLLVIPVAQMDQNRATLFLYERHVNSWRRYDDPIPVILGRNGIAAGIGMPGFLSRGFSKLPQKHEGDGRSPAGLFSLGEVFGYATHLPGIKMPYFQAQTTLHCVDDPQSELYNRIVRAQSGYNSFEKMRREDDLYELGITVGHNLEGEKGRGSCIFIHIQRGDQKPTAGCTAMKREDLSKIIHWLDREKHPALLIYLTD